MWFSEKALVFVDTRSAAIAVYRQTLSGPRLARFAFERFGSHAGQKALFSDVLEDSRAAVSRLARDLLAPVVDATILLPVGASFPSIVDISALRRSRAADIDESEMVRFRLAPLMPFPVAEAEVRIDGSAPAANGSVLAQAILKTTIAESETLMGTLGFKRPRVSSALSAALRGLPARGVTVDLVFGDSACAIAVRDQAGAIDAIHLRLLLEGEDRVQRSIDEAHRAATEVREIRILGADAALLSEKARETPTRMAFDEPALRGSADPQEFPFLAVFRQSAPS